LDGDLIGDLPEVGEEVADLLLAGVDDRSGGGPVDGGSHPLAKLLEAAAQQVQEGVGGQGGFGRHELLLDVRGNRGVAPGLLSRAFLST